MQGTRVELIDTGSGWQSLKPGEYGKWKDGTWYAETPNGYGANLRLHNITEHEDGTISVYPSILVNDNKGELWHGHLTCGVWTEC